VSTEQTALKGVKIDVVVLFQASSVIQLQHG